MRRNAVRNKSLRQLRDKRNEMIQWQGRLKDVPAFVLGNGPSLSDENLSVLEGYFTIGINRSFYLLDTTILMWQDISLWNTESSKVERLKAIKLARNVADPRKQFYNFHVKPGAYHFGYVTDTLFGSGSTGPLAVQLAVALGCSPIVILGMDCDLGVDGRTDFYGVNVHWSPHTMDGCQHGIEFIKQHCPVPIISCSSNKLWDRCPLATAVQIVDPEKRYNLGRDAYIQRLLQP